jgi:anti-sigma factor RsiW
VTQHLDEETLNLAFDGELDPSSEQTTRKHLGDCTECASRYHALERLRELVVLSAAEVVQDVDFDRAFAHIERESRARRSASWLERVRTLVQELAEHKPLRLVAPAVGALAAAAWLLLATRPANGPGATGPVASTSGDRQAGRLDRDESRRKERMMLAARDSEVVQVDFGENSGTVFEIALADGASTPVVWIEE